MVTKFAQSLGIPLFHLPAHLKIAALDGSPLWEVWHRTEPVRIIGGENYSEDIIFFAYTTHHPIVLGLPWLQQHNPTIDWMSRRTTFYSAYCQIHCHSPVSPLVLTVPVQVNQDFLDISSVLACYHDLKEIFSKTRAMSLPPHHSYDCCIDLHSRTTPPQGK